MGTVKEDGHATSTVPSVQELAEKHRRGKGVQIMGTNTPPSEGGAYWYWPESLPGSQPILLWVSTCLEIDAFVATECPDALFYQYVTDLRGTWEGPLHPQSEPDLPAMKIAFVEAWPWLARALEKETDLWKDAGIDVESKVPDEPFIAALRAAWTHTAMISEDRHD